MGRVSAKGDKQMNILSPFRHAIVMAIREMSLRYALNL